MSAWPIRILHLGLGRFHRAHQAIYYQRLFEETGEKWGVAAFSMRTPDARDEMRLVHNRYPVALFSKESAKLQWVEAIRSSFFIQEDREKFLELMSSRDLQVLTLTVTEKAYQTKELYEILAQGLRQRKSLGGQKLTMISCDNLQANGEKLRQGLFDFVAGDDELCTWLKTSVSFPSSMVDRIVPALTVDRRRELQEQFATDNPEILASETFSQWVIEDHFAGAKPPLEKVGVQFVRDVKPFEEMKLQLLNASHSLIAYAGLARGHQFVHQAIRDPEVRAKVEALYAEVIPLLTAPEGFDLRAYAHSLIERFDNERLPHQLKQIAMDGSIKLKQRVLPSLVAAKERGRPHTALDSVIEAWADFCFANTPDDPQQKLIEEMKARSSNKQALHAALLSLLEQR